MNDMKVDITRIIITSVLCLSLSAISYLCIKNNCAVSISGYGVVLGIKAKENNDE